MMPAGSMIISEKIFLKYESYGLNWKLNLIGRSRFKGVFIYTDVSHSTTEFSHV